MALIQIKTRGEPAVSLLQSKEESMPTETIIVIVGIVLAFALFAGTLAWGDYYTGHTPRTG
jgi:hypothetical protein